MRRCGIPQGGSGVTPAAVGRGGRILGTSECWTCGSTSHLSAICPRNSQAPEDDRGPRDSGMRGVVRQVVVGLKPVLLVYYLR